MTVPAVSRSSSSTVATPSPPAPRPRRGGEGRLAAGASKMLRPWKWACSRRSTCCLRSTSSPQACSIRARRSSGDSMSIAAQKIESMLGLSLIGPVSPSPRAERSLTNATQLPEQVHPGPRISRFSFRLGIVDFGQEPGAGEGPIAFRGGARDVHQLGGLINGQAGEVAKFDQFGLGRLAGGETGQGLIQRQQVVLGGVRKRNSLLQIDATASAAMALTLLL